jgi:sugar transferase (PEP-CTERM/EpsH1 system associated)
MANLLYLVHRMPYPPNKGDKVRSYHLLMHLARQHRVFLGTFVDDPDDFQHLPALRALCADVCAVALAPRQAKLRSLSGLLSGDPLTLSYYRSAALQRWVAQTVADHRIDATLVFSSVMAKFAPVGGAGPLVVDLVDVDSAKWTDYAPRHAWPMSWVYRREGRELLAYERSVVARADRSFLVTDNEVALLSQLAPESAGRVDALNNGVDAVYFAPDAARPSPFEAGELPLVFTGAMDYWPNIDAVTWFAHDMLPALRSRWPAARLHIVGRNPSAEVRNLAGPSVLVTGTVPDVRPYLQHAAVVVAPLRLARGVQNKVLEAMAMARPVVAADACVAAIGAQRGSELLAASSADDFIAAIGQLLADAAQADQIGQAARDHVLAHFSWPARLSALEGALGPAFLAAGAPEPAQLQLNEVLA